MKLLSVLSCEFQKITKSAVFWLTLAVFTLMPVMLGFVTSISSGSAGFIPSVSGGSDWSSFLRSLLTGISGLGIVGFSFLNSWVFGREYTDHTIKDLLAKPISRSKVVISKFIIILAWCMFIAMFMFGVGILMGLALGLEGWSSALIWSMFRTFFFTSLLSVAICTPCALIANATKGYLASLGFTLVVIVLSNVMTNIGLAHVFPWTIPQVFLSTSTLGIASIIILGVTLLIGVFGTFAWWKYADQE